MPLTKMGRGCSECLVYQRKFTYVTTAKLNGLVMVRSPAVNAVVRTSSTKKEVKTVQVSRGDSCTMMKRKCFSPQCDIYFLPNKPDQKYCSDRCRSREYKMKKRKDNIKRGLCPQCGGSIEQANKTKRGIPQHCRKCQEYFHKRYIVRRKQR